MNSNELKDTIVRYIVGRSEIGIVIEQITRLSELRSELTTPGLVWEIDEMWKQMDEVDEIDESLKQLRTQHATYLRRLRELDTTIRKHCEPDTWIKVNGDGILCPSDSQIVIKPWVQVTTEERHGPKRG